MPHIGKVTQVIGSTFDVEFPEDQLPSIYNAVVIDGTTKGNEQGEVGTSSADTPSHHFRLVGEVASHLGGGKVRAVALGSTDGLQRGVDVKDTGGPLTVPVAPIPVQTAYAVPM
jgi:F-type H+-transporting ATPase subunit beta